MPMSAADTELKGRHRAMWASGDYPHMVETFLLPLGPRLVEACGIGPGMRVLDVAAGTGHASFPAPAARAGGPGGGPGPEPPGAGPGGARAAGVRVAWSGGGAAPVTFGSASVGGG